MPMILLGGTEAMEKCGSDLKGAINDPPFTSLASHFELRQYLYQAMAWAAGSPTARQILSTVESGPNRIYVVGMKGGGFSCFNSDYPERDSGVVYYNMTLEIAVKFQDSGPTGLATRKKMWPTKPIALHNYIGFLHELGHAKQFVENPAFFREGDEGADRIGYDPSKATFVMQKGKKDSVPLGGGSGAFQSTPKFKSQIEAKARDMFVKKNPTVDVYKAPARGLPDNPLNKKRLEDEERRRRDGMADVAEGLQLRQLRLTKPRWGVRIETDNLNRHEWPICQELGYPKRNYTDLIVVRH